MRAICYGINAESALKLAMACALSPIARSIEREPPQEAVHLRARLPRAIVQVVAVSFAPGLHAQTQVGPRDERRRTRGVYLQRAVKILQRFVKTIKTHEQRAQRSRRKRPVGAQFDGAPNPFSASVTRPSERSAVARWYRFGNSGPA